MREWLMLPDGSSTLLLHVGLESVMPISPLCFGLIYLRKSAASWDHLHTLNSAVLIVRATAEFTYSLHHLVTFKMFTEISCGE